MSRSPRAARAPRTSRVSAAAPGLSPSMDALTARELEVLRLLARGQTNLEIARRWSSGRERSSTTSRTSCASWARPAGPTRCRDTRAPGGAVRASDAPISSGVGGAWATEPQPFRVAELLGRSRSRRRRARSSMQLRAPDPMGCARDCRTRTSSRVRSRSESTRWRSSDCDSGSRHDSTRSRGSQSAIAEVRQVTSPSEMLARAPAILCDARQSAGDRQRCQGRAAGRRERAHFAEDPDGARTVLEQLQERSAAPRAPADRDRADAPAPGDDRRRRAGPSAGRATSGRAHEVAIVRRGAAGRGWADDRLGPRRPWPGPATRRARPRRPVGVRHRARPGVRERPALRRTLRRRARPDEAVPGVAERALRAS